VAGIDKLRRARVQVETANQAGYEVLVPGGGGMIDQGLVGRGDLLQQ
jgi:hypothetical protein